MSDYQHPYETVNLPSEGKFYPEGHALRSGTVDIKYLTAKEEDILTSTNLVSKGIVFDKLLESIILTKHEDGRSISVDDILVGDIDALLVAARVLAYGKEYPVSQKCLHCSAQNNIVADLTQLEPREVDLQVDEKGHFTYDLKGTTVKLRLLTRGDEKRIKKELKVLSDRNLPSTEITTRLRSVVAGVGDNETISGIRQFCSEILIPDSRELRDFYAKQVPGIDFSYKFVCEACNTESEGWVQLDPTFFWPEL